MINNIFKKKPRNLTGSGVAVFDDKNRILLHQRADIGLWAIPGGILELGEETSECAKREIYEETGLTIKELELYNVYSGKEMYCKYPDGNEFYFTSVVYISRDFEGEINIDYTESRDVRFFDLDNLPEIISTNKRMIDDLIISETKHRRLK